MYYWGIFFLLIIFLCIEIINGKINRKFFYIAYFILTALIVLRQGQGTDYYSYSEIYDIVAKTTNIGGLLLVYHGEIGFLFLNYIATRLGFSYQLFSALFALITMIVYYPFFSKKCQCSIIPLFLFYAMVFLVYPFSGIRQGLTLGIMVSSLFPLLEERKYLPYILITILGATFHKSIIVCLFIPFIYRLRVPNMLLFIFFLFLCLMILLGIDVLRFFPQLSAGYEGRTGNFYFSMIARIIMLIPIFLVKDETYKKNQELLHIRNILFFGFIIYALCSSNDLTAGRLGIYCRIFEGYFIFQLLYKTRLIHIPKQVLLYSLLFVTVIFTKNIGVFIKQGQYEGCNIFTYPYFSIFDAPDEITTYRKKLFNNE